MDNVVTLFSDLPAGEAPEWIHLVPAGTFRGASPRKSGPWTLHDAQAVIAASLASGPLPIDENHAIDLAGPKGGPSPARGWIVELQGRDDGIWGRVEWTEPGRTLVGERGYRGISPVIESERGSGRVVRIHRAALTNTPNLPVTTLHSTETDMDPDKLREALGLAANADEAAILAAIAARNTAIEAHAADLARIAEAAGLEADQPSADGLVTHLQAQGADAGDADELRQTVISLQSELTTLQGDIARRTAEAAIDQAITDGKPIKPLREHYISRHMKDPDAVAKELGAMVSIHAGGLGERRPADEEHGLTEEEVTVHSQLGLTAEEFAKSKAEAPH